MIFGLILNRSWFVHEPYSPERNSRGGLKRAPLVSTASRSNFPGWRMAMAGWLRLCLSLKSRHFQRQN
jgi:hypothetical protein